MGLEGAEKDEAVEDIVAQGISSTRIISLSLCMVVGRVLPLSKSSTCKWGEDPALSAVAKEYRKAELRTLKDVLKDGSAVEVSTYFADLMRELAAVNRVEESSRIGSWWAEAQACFASDKKLLLGYVKEYIKKYTGRGIPVMLDTVIVARERGRAAVEGGASREELKTVRSKQEAASSEISDLKKALSDLKRELRPPRNQKQDEEPPPKNKSKVKCYNCGKKGHFASEYPEPKRDPDHVDDE